MKTYAIKDTKMGFGAIFTAKNKAVALRMFADTANDKTNMIGMHPEDYELYELGEYNEDTGELTSKVEFIERATAFTEINK